MTEDLHTSVPPYLTAPGPHQKPLEAFIGRWNATWSITVGPDAPPLITTGTDTFEWVEGVFVILHRSTTLMGPEQYYNVVDFIGYDAPGNGYRSCSFDNQQNALDFTVSVEASTWTFTGDAQRATIVIAEDGQTMHAQWELSTDGVTWNPWIEVRYTRAD